jgi:dUTPase
MSTPTSILISPALAATLDKNGISPENYSPAYGGESAGLDLFYTGTEPIVVKPSGIQAWTDFDNILDTSCLEVGRLHKLLIPTGLHVALPVDRVALIQERSSVSKTPLKLRAGVIDAGYTGEIFCNCVNVSARDFVIQPHEKLPFQLLILPVFNKFQPIPAEDWDAYVKDAARRNGALGSSD